MFSNNQFPHLISPPSLIFGHERDHEFLLHHHDDLLSGHFLQANAPVIDNFPAAFANHDVNRPFGSHCDSLNFLPKKKLPVKKDRHSKICTAQGLRDRRVRLSIEIARKFFDLQDMLGFDKASKTLDWLFTKSKTAIEELAQKSLSSTSECAVISPGTNELAANNGDISKKKKKKKKTPLITSRVNKEKMMRKQAHNYSFQDLLVRESRAEARARARERTREKLRLRKFNESKSQSSIWNQIEPWEIFCYEQNLINISKAVSSNNNNYYSFNITGNWDISDTTIQANRSTEFCVSKPWDVYNHQISHD